MSRPDVSVVMPFAGDPAAARDALSALRSLLTQPGDELILVDNAGAVGPEVLEASGTSPASPAQRVELVRATAERSPAYARNAGAAQAQADWILFIDADCEPRPDLLDAYFAQAVTEEIGALAGEVQSAPAAQTLVGRYGATRGFLSQRIHFEHPYRPRAAAANLMVRRAAFEAVGGFYEGVRAAEDTDFTWRLQQAGWRLELRPEAFVMHRYRTTLSELRRQWRGYAAGRAWLARRYDGFEPEPGVARAVRRVSRRARRSAAERPTSRAPAGTGRLERGTFVALDALLSVEELAGLALSNRPSDRGQDRDEPPEVVLVADRFPAQGDPLVELARTLERVRVEALGRPDTLDLDLARGVDVEYVEDDGTLSRAFAVVLVAARHPLRSVFDVLRRRPGDPRLRELAPAVRRVEHDRDARVQALGGGSSARFAERLAGLAGRRLNG